jgi:hypothetical protein
MGKQLFVAILVLGLGTIAIAFSRLPERCPLSWDGAERIEMPAGGSTAYIRVDPLHVYSVSGSAMLNYMPTVDSGPLTRLGPIPHPLSVVLGVGSGFRSDLEDAHFTCVRVTHGDELWTSRPQNYDIQSPQWDLPGPSGRMAGTGGPEWPAGDQIQMEAWLQIGARRVVLVFPPFALMKGG